MTTQARPAVCTECLDRRDCWVCDSTGSVGAGPCRTCTGTGRCRRCSPVQGAVPVQQAVTAELVLPR